MKIVSLNTWGGTRGKIFFDYIKKQSKSSDFFCFQEIFDSPRKKVMADGTHTGLYGTLKAALPGFKAYFLPAAKNISLSGPVDFSMREGLVIFVKKGFQAGPVVTKHLIGKLSNKTQYTEGKENSAILCLKVTLPNKKFFWLLNFHGISRPGDKLDTPSRLKQSKGIVNVLKKIKGPKILCGDFNLMPQTKSIKMIERQGMRNLIKDYKIKNTRNTISWTKYNNRQSYADFTFVSSEVSVKSFKVPYNLVSDHLPMIISFAITDKR